MLPVGGIKEKVLAAHRLGVKEVLLPRRNEKAVKELLAKGASPNSVSGQWGTSENWWMI